MHIKSAKKAGRYVKQTQIRQDSLNRSDILTRSVKKTVTSREGGKDLIPGGSCLLEDAVLHVEDGADVLLQVEVVPVPLAAVRTLDGVVPAEGRRISVF